MPEVPFPRARHGGSVNGVAFSPHGTLLASATGLDTVHDPDTAKALTLLGG